MCNPAWGVLLLSRHTDLGGPIRPGPDHPIFNILKARQTVNEASSLTTVDVHRIRALMDAAMKQPHHKQWIAALFLAHQLDLPEKIEVHLAAFRGTCLGLPEGIRTVWLIIKDSPQSVFYDAFTGSFGACWGPEKDTGSYIDLGFRSDDPIEMYTA